MGSAEEYYEFDRQMCRSEMPTPVGDHNDDPQVAAFLAMVETEAKLRATIAELRAENATLRQHIEEFCSRDTASEIAIEETNES